MLNLLSIWYVKYGVLAQLGEHLPYKQRVIGSSPITSTIDFLSHFPSVAALIDVRNIGGWSGVAEMAR